MQRSAHAGDRASRLIVVFHQRSWRGLRWLIVGATTAVTIPRLWSLSQSAMLGDVRVAVQEAAWIFGLLVAACVLHRLAAMGVHVIQLRERLRRTQHRLHTLESAYREDNALHSTALTTAPPYLASTPPLMPAGPVRVGAVPSAVAAAPTAGVSLSSDTHDRGDQSPSTALAAAPALRDGQMSAGMQPNGKTPVPGSINGDQQPLVNTLALRANLREAIGAGEWKSALRAGRTLRAAMPDSRWAAEFHEIEPLLRRLCNEGPTHESHDALKPYPSASVSAVNGDCYHLDEAPTAPSDHDASPVANPSTAPRT